MLASTSLRLVQRQIRSLLVSAALGEIAAAVQAGAVFPIVAEAVASAPSPKPRLRPSGRELLPSQSP